jgi:hypothetical protein
MCTPDQHCLRAVALKNQTYGAEDQLHEEHCEPENNEEDEAACNTQPDTQLVRPQRPKDRA